MTYNNTRTLSNTTTGFLSESLTADKNSLQQSYSAGERITYVVSLINSGQTDYEDLTVTDDLGAFTPVGGTTPVYPLTYDDGSAALYVDGAQQTPPVPQTTEPLVFTGISVPAGGNAVLIYSAQANGSAPLVSGSSVTNTAEVSGASLGEPLTASVTLNVSEAPYLTIEKTLSPLTVSPGQSISYTFVISNYGNTEADATADVTITDTFSPVLTGLTATFNGAAWAVTTDYTYSEATGEFASVPGVITVPAATYVTEPDGTVTTTPGTATLVIEGTVA